MSNAEQIIRFTLLCLAMAFFIFLAGFGAYAVAKTLCQMVMG